MQALPSPTSSWVSLWLLRRPFLFSGPPAIMAQNTALALLMTRIPRPRWPLHQHSISFRLYSFYISSSLGLTTLIHATLGVETHAPMTRVYQPHIAAESHSTLVLSNAPPPFAPSVRPQSYQPLGFGTLRLKVAFKVLPMGPCCYNS